MRMEVLSILLCKAMVGGFISRCRFRGRDEKIFSISNLFANGTIVFFEIDKDELVYLS